MLVFAPDICYESVGTSGIFLQNRARRQLDNPRTLTMELRLWGFISLSPLLPLVIVTSAEKAVTVFNPFEVDADPRLSR